MSDWGVATETGRVRRANEDCHLARPPVFVVADGMGGHAAGDVASRITAEAFARAAAPLGAHNCAEVIAAANEAILVHVAGHPDTEGMGTTVAGLAVVDVGGADHWQVFNVGDCRVYRLGGDGLRQLTVDHSEAEELVAAGRLTRAEARSYERRNVVTRSLGTAPAPLVDSWIFPPEPPEWFLVCSDGLTTEVDDEAIESVLRSSPTPQAAADALVAMAVDAGGRDNVTALVVAGADPAAGEVDGDTRPRGGSA